MTREDLQKWIESLGGRLGNTVTRKTDLLIIGEEPGRKKIEDARRNGTPFIHHSLFVYLGLGREYGRFDLVSTDAKIILSLAIQMAILCEEILTYAEETNDDKYWNAFEWCSTGLEGLLSISWPLDESRGVIKESRPSHEDTWISIAEQQDSLRTHNSMGARRQVLAR